MKAAARAAASVAMTVSRAGDVVDFARRCFHEDRFLLPSLHHAAITSA